MDSIERCDASAAAGTVAWVVVALLVDVDTVAAAVLFAVLVLVPAALPLAATPRRDGTHSRSYRWATAAQPAAAALFAASTLVASTWGAGRLAAALALPWVGVAALLAQFGLWRLLPRGFAPIEETLLDAGLVYLPVGALAAVAWRLDLGLGYGLDIVHLTAAHYHYATFLLPVVAAAVGRYRRPGRLYRVAAVVLVLGVPLIAAGITASPALEAVAATLFAAAVVVVAALFAGVAGEEAGRDQGAAALLVVAAVSAGLTMALAVAYAVGQWVGPTAIAIPAMVHTHGLLNAFGFALPAVLAWRRLDPPSRARPPGVPFGGQVAQGRVGPDFPERTDLAGEPLPGQIDTVDRYASPQFDAAALDDRVRRFYERTVEYRLTYRVAWHAPVRWGAGLASALTCRIEQLNLPTDGAVHEMVGRCPRLAVDDPRTAPRFWVRTDPENGRGVFVATYGVHEQGGTAYMNIGMPLPGATLAAVLVPRNAGKGLALSATEATGGDAGLYLVVPHLGPVGLPLRERFRVWPADAAGAPEPPEEGDYELTATHEMSLLGWPLLTVGYGIDHDEALAFEDAR